MKYLKVTWVILKGMISIPFKTIYVMITGEKLFPDPVKANSIAKDTNPESFQKGEEFEQYLRKYIFTKEDYVCTHRTHDYQMNKDDYIESSLLPDFGFRHKETGYEFYVEAKFRSNYYNDGVQFCNFQQLKRYREVNNQKPTFIAIGLEGKPHNPNKIFLFPITKARTINFQKEALAAFEIEKMPFRDILEISL